MKSSLLIAMFMLCVHVPIVRAGDVVPLEWTSPTTDFLHSVDMVSADDGWAVGESGTILRWTGTVWVPEFPTVILMPLLISLTIGALTLAKKAKKRERTSLPSKAQL